LREGAKPQAVESIMHAPDTEEPNLVPLLDLVLQMVMFFMACTNFAKENISEAVKLPLAQSAKPIEDEELKNNERIYVNLQENGNARVPPFTDENGTRWYTNGMLDDVVTNEAGEPILGADGRLQHDPKLRPARFEKYFQRVFDNRIKRVKRDLGGNAAEDAVKAEVAKRTMIILRAHQNAYFLDVYEVLNKSRRAGFSKMQLRATMDTKPST
jgi:biopolymer transport protein ExbD